MKQQTLILMVGHDASGKTTVAQKIQTDLGAVLVEGDSLRSFLSEEMSYFRGLNISIPNSQAATASKIARDYRLSAAKHLLGANQDVIFSAGNLKKAVRANIFDSLCGEGGDAIHRVILYAKIDERQLLSRLKQREASQKNTEWVRHYREFRKQQLVPPTADECDALITYTQDNYEQVKDQLNKVMYSD